MIALDRYAERLLTTARVDDAGPVSVPMVCAALGYVIYRIQPPDPRLAGLMLFDDVARYGERRLYVAAATPETYAVRAAHLLGHALLHGTPLPPNAAGFKDTARTVTLTTVVADPREAEANAFAASLLMPRRRVVPQWRAGGGLDALADAFGVSVDAAAQRVRALGLVAAPRSPRRLAR